MNAETVYPDGVRMAVNSIHDDSVERPLKGHRALVELEAGATPLSFDPWCTSRRSRRVRADRVPINLWLERNDLAWNIRKTYMLRSIQTRGSTKQPDNRRVPVMKLWHGVEEVRNESSAMLHSCSSNGRGSSARHPKPIRTIRKQKKEGTNLWPIDIMMPRLERAENASMTPGTSGAAVTILIPTFSFSGKSQSFLSTRFSSP